ncbi:hypothetical protein [Lentilactobacillus otakiensis]|uniref:hypothetical protein n=1 Tax=Lentilactobacillus otakiensis TaxID=481720 RepID=UPI003D184C42
MENGTLTVPKVTKLTENDNAKNLDSLPLVNDQGKRINTESISRSHLYDSGVCFNTFGCYIIGFSK